jgi:hypothetical protein
MSHAITSTGRNLYACALRRDLHGIAHWARYHARHGSADMAYSETRLAAHLARLMLAAPRPCDCYDCRKVAEAIK